MDNSLLNTMEQHIFINKKNGWILVTFGNSELLPGYYVFGKIDDPQTVIYFLKDTIKLGRYENVGCTLGIRVLTPPNRNNMEKVSIDRKVRPYVYEMSNGFYMNPRNTFVSFVSYPNKDMTMTQEKMVRHEQLLNDPEHYDHLASEIRNDAFRELAIASVEDSSLFNELKKLSRSDNEFYKGSSEEILKIRATDVFILDLIKRISNEEMKRNEEREQKEKQRQIDEYIRQCEYEKSRIQREERERKLEEEYLRYKNTKYETNYEENTSHYQPATYSRKR